MIMGNEMANKLAKEAHTSAEEFLNVSWHFSELSEKYNRTIVDQKWQSDWSESEKGRFCHSIIPSVIRKPWYHNSKFSRQKITFWNRIISNHTRSAQSLSRFNIVDNPMCEKLSMVDHMIFECEVTSDSELKAELKSMGIGPPWCIRDIVASKIYKNGK
jgi:hypothetical protein